MDNDINGNTNVKFSNPPIIGIAFLFLLASIIISWRKISKGSKIKGPIGLIFSFIGFFGVFKAINSNDDKAMFFAIVFWAIGWALLVNKSKNKNAPWKRKKGIRRPFPKQTREQVLKDQKFRCAGCKDKIHPPLIHFDHIDGNRSNNKISNCQALCPNCHVLKTHDDRQNQ